MSNFSDNFSQVVPDLMGEFGDSVSFYSDSAPLVAVSVTGLLAIDGQDVIDDEVGESRLVQGRLTLAASDVASVSLPGQFEISGERWAVDAQPIVQNGLAEYRVVRIMRREVRSEGYVR